MGKTVSKQRHSKDYTIAKRNIDEIHRGVQANKTNKRIIIEHYLKLFIEINRFTKRAKFSKKEKKEIQNKISQLQPYFEVPKDYISEPSFQMGKSGSYDVQAKAQPSNSRSEKYTKIDENNVRLTKDDGLTATKDSDKKNSLSSFRKSKQSKKSLAKSKGKEEMASSSQSQIINDDDNLKGKAVKTTKNVNQGRNGPNPNHFQTVVDTEASNKNKEDKPIPRESPNEEFVVLHQQRNEHQNSFKIDTNEKKEESSQNQDTSTEEQKVAEDTEELHILNVHQIFQEGGDINSVDKILDFEERIEAIEKFARDLESKVNTFEDIKSSLDYFILDEKLMQLIEKLNKIKSDINSDTTKNKLRVIKYISQLQAELNCRVKSKS